MKKNLFILVSLLLIGCTNANNSTNNHSSSKNGVSTCYNSSTTNNNQTFSSTMSNSSFSPIISSTTDSSLPHNNDWQESVKKEIKNTLGDINIPYYKANYYYAGNSEYNGIPYVFIDCFGSNINNAVSDYENILLDAGFNVSSIYEGLGTKEISNTHVLYLEYLVVEDCFEIVAYINQDKIDYWPSEEIKNIIKYDIPRVEAETYQFYISTNIDGYQCLDIYSFGVKHNYISIYKELLEDNSYVVTEFSGLYLAINNEISMELSFYMYDDTTLFIQAYCFEKDKWPSEEIKELLGFDLPIYEEEGVSYDVQLIVDENSEIFAVYCDGASSDSLNKYSVKLKEQGWVLDEAVSLENSECYFYNKDLDDEHYIQIVYNDYYKCLVIAIIY